MDIQDSMNELGFTACLAFAISVSDDDQLELPVLYMLIRALLDNHRVPETCPTDRAGILRYCRKIHQAGKFTQPWASIKPAVLSHIEDYLSPQDLPLHPLPKTTILHITGITAYSMYKETPYAVIYLTIGLRAYRKGYFGQPQAVHQLGLVRFRYLELCEEAETEDETDSEDGPSTIQVTRLVEEADESEDALSTNDRG